jgi:hypothetical protein
MVDSELPMRDPKHLDNSNYLAMAEALKVHCEDEQIFGRDWYDPDCYATKILDAKYEEVSTNEVVEQCTHLSTTQKEDLRKVLKDFPNSLMAPLEFTHTENSTSTSCQVPSQSMSDPMQ